MNNFEKYKILVIVSFFSTIGLGQETIPSTGSQAIGVGGTSSYTVGQVVYHTYGITTSEAQGVQQPYEISIITNTTGYIESNSKCTIYPNPSTTLLQLEIEDHIPQKYTYILYDMSGQQLKSQEFNTAKTNITMSEYPPAIYILHVMAGEKILNNFKLIKK